ncbi:MAG TPA: mannonate dehydratase [Acidimicrobiales bacterium]|nr:mannonate dehydratase [Acidimicrobiales bacterium]
MVRITELLTLPPRPLWRLVKQVGVDEVVSLLDGAEQQWRWPPPGDPFALPPVYVAPPEGERPWELRALAHLQSCYREYGLELAVIEDTAPMDAVRLGLPGRDEQIDWICTQIRAMGQLGIGSLCYNWHAISGWSRTSADVALRGGAGSTRYDDAEMRRHPRLIEPGSVTTEQLWAAVAYFLSAAVPVAEESGVRLCLHPDDPPIAEVRGVPRIMNSPEAFERVLSIADSDCSGITFCQGNFTLMTEDLPALIRRFGARRRIFFVHFRDVAGQAGDFVEVFHDEGPTDMLACMRAYAEVGFDGPMRPDHVPALEGEVNSSYGYETLGRLFAVGYIAGLREAAYGRPPTSWGRARPRGGWPSLGGQ